MFNESKQIIFTGCLLTSFIYFFDLLFNEFLLASLVIRVRCVDVPNELARERGRNKQATNCTRNHILRKLVVVLLRLLWLGRSLNLANLRGLEELAHRAVHHLWRLVWALLANLDILWLYFWLDFLLLVRVWYPCLNIFLSNSNGLDSLALAFFFVWLVPLILDFFLFFVKNALIFNLLELLLHFADRLGRLVGLGLLLGLVYFVSDVVNDLAGDRNKFT
jgi:hypothetical protein